MVPSIPALQKSFSSYRTLLTAENNLIVVYFCFGLIGILHHEMWRDEMQSWLIARDSDSLTELFENTKDEGHPALWYLCLYVLSQLTHNPLIMQIFHLLIATGVVILFVKFSPFSQFNRFIFPFGYFAFYEYSIISRNYNLGVFLLFLFCVLYSRNKENYIAFGIILALLANVNAFALIASFIIFLALLTQVFYHHEQYLNSEGRWRNLAMGAVIAAFGWAVSVIQIGRVADEAKVLRAMSAGAIGATQENSSTQIFVEESRKLILELTSIWRSYVPIPDVSLQHFWNINFLIDSKIDDAFLIAGSEIGKFVALILTLIIVITTIRLLSGYFVGFFIYGVGTLSIILFNYFALNPELRHHGHLFLLFIVALWLANSHLCASNSLEQNSVRFRWINRWLGMFLCLQLVAGIYIYSMDLIRPFSVMKSAAAYLQSHGLQDQFILGYRYRQVSVLAGYLDRQIFYAESQQLGSFWLSREKEIKSEKKLLNIVQEVRRQNDTDILLVLTQPIKPPVELNIVELERFQGAIESSENEVYLYLARNL
jgi:hypothetical protein